MLGIILIILLIFFILKSMLFRWCLRHPITVSTVGIKDIKNYFKQKKYNNYTQYGRMIAYTASGAQVFGCGKTLTMVKDALSIYHKYDGLEVWDDKKKEFVIQHVHLISNVDLSGSGVPYYPWVDECQLSHIEKFGFPDQDINIFLLDEAATIFNSRSFKTNISEVLLSSLLQQRKYKVIIMTTSQRFKMIDKLIRDTTSMVTTCKKWWRIVITQNFDAYDVENCDNVGMLQPLSTRIWFAKDKDYHAYDTYQHVKKLQKINDEGGFLSTQEIINARGDTDTDINSVQNPKRKKRYRKY